MSTTLAIPDQLADRLRTLAAARGISVEQLGEQAITVGLTTLTGTETADIVDIGLTQAAASRTTRSMRSPISARGPIRPLQITFEPDTKASDDAD
jgi:hypothetical protein